MRAPQWRQLCLSLVSLAMIASSSAQECTLPSPVDRVGPYAPNNILQTAEKLYEGKVYGPESVAVYKDYIYTGLPDGWVKQLHNGEVINLARFGADDCEETGSPCGRPMGVRVTEDGSFVYVSDAIFGLFKVNTSTGEYEQLFSPGPINGEPALFLNDLDVADDGKVYFSSSASGGSPAEFTKSCPQLGTTGRLLVYDPATGEVSELLRDLFIANGVQVMADGNSVLVIETPRHRINKYDLLTGSSSVWVDNLPGTPGNVRMDKAKGTYWVAFSHSYLKPLSDDDDDEDCDDGEDEDDDDEEGTIMAVELDGDGNILRSIQDLTSEVFGFLSEVSVADGALYAGDHHIDFVGRVDASNL